MIDGDDIPGTAGRSWSWLAVAMGVAAVTWLAITALPTHLAGPGGLGAGTIVTGAVAGGAAAGCLAGLFRRRCGGAGRAVAAVALGVLVTAAVTFVLPGVGPVVPWGGGTTMQVGTGAVILVATVAGFLLALLAVFGPVWWRACALAVPVVFLQDALDAVVPPVPVLDIDSQWFGAVLLGVALGASVGLERVWTWAMWVPALTLVWLAQSLAYAMDATLQQLRAAAGYLREYPTDPFIVLGDHLGHTLVDPGEHGPLAMWLIAVQMGVAVAAWRLRSRTDAAEAAHETLDTAS
ncbi:hypothetical protein [Myceligenerans crystallogenes]|uniref:hypothetical protein n=1 Tax=Myceligenerans crystallogenes TaxID=316335 RepID=UPI0031DEC148